jgi:hypothetical protein
MKTYFFCWYKRIVELQGLPQPEGHIDDWQRAWDEIANIHLEGEGEQTDADAAIQRKRPDAWAVNCSVS